jgi:hypothetical protein
VSSPDGAPAVDFVYEVGGVTITTSILSDDVEKVLAWSTSEVILYLGSEGPLLQKGLREIFGS